MPSTKEEIAIIRNNTFCIVCGGQPIEWHNSEHKQYPSRRISRMLVSGVSLSKIKQEIAKCTPYCHKCHMKMHGIPEQLTEKHKIWIKEHRKPKIAECIRCKKCSTPIVKGMCISCYNYVRHYDSYYIKYGKLKQ